MKALSIKQPWAWLIVNGFKDVENRTWPTRQTGLILVHAGKSFDHDGFRWVRQNFPHIEMPHIDNFEFGGIVGRVRIVDCVCDCDSPWFVGPWGFSLESPAPLPFRPVRGQLGFFDVPDTTVAPPAAGAEGGEDATDE